MKTAIKFMLFFFFISPNPLILSEESTPAASEDKPWMALQDNFIVIGSSLPIESYGKMYGISMLDGMTMAINKANDKGGIKGKILKLITLNDDYNPDKSRTNIDTFLTEHKTDLILYPYGDPTLNAYVNKAEKKEVLVMFPNSEIGITLPYVIHLRSSYKEQGATLAEYLLKEKKVNKIAIVYQDDKWARDAKDSAFEVFKKAGIAETNLLGISINRGALSLDTQIEKIKKFNPNAIGFFTMSVSAREIIDGLDLPTISKATIFGMDTLSEARFESFLNKKGIKAIVTNAVPNPTTSDLEIVKEYRQEAEKKGISLNTYSLEAYINASLFIDILKRMDKPLSKENIVEFISTIKDYPFKGLTLSFKNPGLLHSLWISNGEDANWKEIKLRTEEK